MDEQTNQKQNQAQTNQNQADLKDSMNKFEAFLDEYLVKKAPFALPLGFKEFIVSIAPWATIVFAILAIPIILAAIGLTAFLTPFSMLVGGFGWTFGTVVSLVVAVVTLVMELIAVPGLFKRTRASWRLVFYASIISLIGSLLHVYGALSGIIGAIIGWYILFQVKDMYKN